MIIHADCVEAMQAMEPDSVDAIVCDPPYGLEFMGKEWDRFVPERGTSTAGVAEATFGSDGAYAKARGGTSPPTTRRCQRCNGWTGSFSEARGKRQKRCECPSPSFPPGAGAQLIAFQRWCEAWATDALRVLRPGGHLLAFGGTRTYHRLACAVEDAGFEIRDSLIWIYGSGFPKSRHVGRAIDAERGVESRRREYANPGDPDVDNSAGRGQAGSVKNWGGGEVNEHSRSPQWQDGDTRTVPEGVTPEAQHWQGWGTALKPSHEPIVVARKPLVGTVAANVLEHGTGALNIDGCRIEGSGWTKQDGDSGAGFKTDKFMGGMGRGEPTQQGGLRESESGRWPPNLTLSHLPECKQTGTRKVKSHNPDNKTLDEGANGEVYGDYGQRSSQGHADSDGTETIPAYSCAPGCPVAELDRQSGERPSNGGRVSDSDMFAMRAQPDIDTGYGDTGGASRFFYVAKASRAERNAGLEGFEEQGAGVLQARTQEEGIYLEFTHPAPAGLGEWLRKERVAAGLTLKAVAAHFPSRTGGLTGCVTNWEREFNRPTPDQWRKLRDVIGFDGRYDEVMTTQHEVDRELFDGRDRQIARNAHPTVKPIALMRWLVRLVTPKGGTVLDPFTGSGSTGVAAVLEGFDFVGIEREAEYVALAEARVKFWAQFPGADVDKVLLSDARAREIEASGQLGLL